MSKYFVRQPDGKSAVFCDVADEFVCWDIQEREQLEVFQHFSRGIRAPENWRHAASTRLYGMELSNAAEGALARWNHALVMLGCNGGSGGVEERVDTLRGKLVEMGFGDYEVPAWVVAEIAAFAAETTVPLSRSIPSMSAVSTPSVMDDAFWAEAMPRAAAVG
jgi:hypothetical protein